ncbi:hypothetical protein [Spirillospora sp. NPDC029432]|uniref:hypothetical protein n=1 Tax=Spirillospora sp. NPDC029432 TaxID=3154599 RepID=UPI003454DA8B
MESHEPWVLPYGAPVPDGTADAGTAPPAALVEELVAAGRPVLVTLAAEGPDDGGGGEPDPGMLAAASVYAWLGVRAFRAPEGALPALRQVLDMVAAIQGSRPPALARRGLA